MELEQTIIMAEEALAEYESNLSFAKLHLSKAKSELDQARRNLITESFDWGRAYGRWADAYNHLPKKYREQFSATHFAKPQERQKEANAEFAAAFGEFERRAVAVGIEQKKRDDAKDRLDRLRGFAESGGEILIY